MDLHGIKLLLATSIVISFISTTHSFDHDKPGVCAKPCKGGVHDLCLDCASNCVATCENPSGLIPGEDCNHMCRVNACHCAKGFVRAPDNQCVLPHQCPQVQPISNLLPKLEPSPLPEPVPFRNPKCPICTGGSHDHCVECHSSCAPVCGQARNRICTMECGVNVCECDSGYARASNGTCIPEHQCPLINPIHPPLLSPPTVEHPQLPPSKPVQPPIQHPLFPSPSPLPPTIHHPLLPPSAPLPLTNQHPQLPPPKPLPTTIQHPILPSPTPVPPTNHHPTSPLPSKIEHPLSPPSKPLPPTIQHPLLPSPTPSPPTNEHPQLHPPKPLPTTIQHPILPSPTPTLASTIEHPLSPPPKPLPPTIQRPLLPSPTPSPPTNEHPLSPTPKPLPTTIHHPISPSPKSLPPTGQHQQSHPSKPLQTRIHHSVSSSPKSWPPPCPVCTGGIHDQCVSCGSACPPTCGLSDDRICTKQCKVNVCQCVDGYKRAPNGKCVPESHCPQIHPIHHPLFPSPEPSEPECPVCTGGHHDHCLPCASACPPTCGLSNDRVCTEQCKVNTCQCDEGYKRASNGKCIPESQCPQIHPIHRHPVPVPLPKPSPPKYPHEPQCSSIDPIYPRPNSGEVSLEPQCPVCTGGDHDHCVSCGSACPNTCGVSRNVYCTMQCIVNVCECDEGYARAPNGICIPEYFCPEVDPMYPELDSEEISLESECPVCTGGDHDHCVSCGSSCPLTCSQPEDQACATVCQTNVCQCDSGYARADNGTCIPEHLCPQIDLIDSEEYSGETISDPEPNYDEESDPKPNYKAVSDPEPDYDVVISDPECPVCTGGDHDHCVSCGSACPNTCGVSKNLYCTTQCIVNVCECDEGYARAPNGICIPDYFCPEVDPIYSDPDYEEVPSESECPVCTGGEHDHCTECGSYCPLTCDDPPDACTTICKPFVCECDEGFVRGPTGKCIRRSQCPEE